MNGLAHYKYSYEWASKAVCLRSLCICKELCDTVLLTYFFVYRFSLSFLALAIILYIQHAVCSLL